MRHTVLVATLSSVVASVLTTAVISGSLFGADTASSANTPVEAEGAVLPAGVTGILQGDINCDVVVDARDALGDLRYVGGLSVEQDEPCPDIGTLAAMPGPQGPPGINLWATVRSDGTLIRGTATGASQIETGTYLVTFGQDVAECAPMANSGISNGGLSFATDATASTVTASFLSVGENEVAVVLENPLDRIDTDFHLIVAC